MEYSAWCTVLVLVISSIEIIESQNTRTGCPSIKLTNGRIRYRQRGRFAKFQCSTGWIIAGDKYSSCIKGKWDNPVPKCVRPTCKKVSPPNNGFIYPEYRGALLKFYCLPNFVLRGSESTFCDGSKWSSNVPTCVRANEEPKFNCDFESDDLCGWTHDLNHDFNWRRQNYKTPSGHVGTGPSFDHTKGKGEDGYYVYVESSSRIENDTARLLSPVYNKMENGFCFQFYYHMFGETTGKLRVYVNKVDDTIDFKKLKPQFQKSGNQGDQWHMGYVSVDSIDQPFQVIIEGVRGLSYTSDIAIDDVSLFEKSCQENEIDTPTSTEISESIPIYDSCENRCYIEQNDTYNCECTESCYELNTCCPDFNIFCIIESSDFETESTPYYTTDETTLTTMPKIVSTKIFSSTTIPHTTKTQTTKLTQPPTTSLPKISTKKHEIITKKVVTSPVTKKIITTTIVIPKTTTKIIKITATAKRDTTSKMAATTKMATMKKTTAVPKKYVTKPNKKDNEVVKPKKETKLTTIYEEDYTTKALPIETDYFNDKENSVDTMEHHQMVKQKTSNSKVIIFAGLGSFLFVLVGVVGIFLILRRYGFIGNFRGLGTVHSESMSDVRFLASDEVLDFTLRSPDD